MHVLVNGISDWGRGNGNWRRIVVGLPLDGTGDLTSCPISDREGEEGSTVGAIRSLATLNAFGMYGIHRSQPSLTSERLGAWTQPVPCRGRSRRDL